MVELDRKFESDLDKFRTAFFKDFETHISTLKTSFKESQQSVIDVQDALKLSDKRNRHNERDLREKKQRVTTLASELSIQKREANTKNNEAAVELLSTKADLHTAKRALEEAKRQAASLQQDLNAARQRFSVLEKDYATAEHKDREHLKELDDVKERKIHLEAELELIRRESEYSQQRLKAAEQQNVDFKADLQATTKRASSAEDKLQAFKSRFQQINDDMAALVSSSGQRPIMTQPVSSQLVSSALAPVEEGSVEKRDSGPETNDALTRPQGLDSHVSNTMSNKESDFLSCQRILAEVMDIKNWQYNQYFLKVMDSLTLASLDAKVGPMNLGTMKEKLAKWDYASVTSFKEDFDLIIADSRRLNAPKNPIRIAAEELSKIFHQAFPAQPIPSHAYLETARSNQGTNSKKRKAETDTLVSSEDGYAQKRRSCSTTKQDTNHIQAVNPGTGGSVIPATSSSNQPQDNSHAPEEIDARRVKGKITTGTRLGIDEALSVVGQLVSVAKSPNTISGHWKSLVPDKYWLTNHARPEDVRCRYLDLTRGLDKDMIILRLTPAAEADRPGFDRICNYFFEKQRFATVSHTGIDNVENIHLVPASRAAYYPEFFSTLDLDLLPPAQTEDVLFMAIVFCVAEDKQKQVRRAWDHRMEAIQDRDKDGLTSMRKVLVRNPLHFHWFPRTVVSSAERHLARFRELPYAGKRSSPSLEARDQDITLRISYTTFLLPRVAGAVAPELVFVLGRLLLSETIDGFFVIDITNKDRPLWLIHHDREEHFPWGCRWTMVLLSRKFPGSLREWEKTTPRVLRTPGLKLERWGPGSKL
jgi:hypothetical protein